MDMFVDQKSVTALPWTTSIRQLDQLKYCVLMNHILIPQYMYVFRDKTQLFLLSIRIYTYI